MALLAQWLLNEAASGTTPTSVADTEASPANLAITYGGGNWTSIASGRGLTGTNGPLCMISAGIDTSHKFYLGLHGSTAATLIVVVDYSTLTNTPTLMGVGDGDGDGVIAIRSASGGQIFMHVSGSDRSDFTGGLVTTSTLYAIHAVWDSSNATAGDRLRLYRNGTLVYSQSVTQNEALSWTGATNGRRVTIGGSTDEGGRHQGGRYYGAILSHAMTGAEVSTNATALLANNDASPFGGGAAAPPPMGGMRDVLTGRHPHLRMNPSECEAAEAVRASLRRRSRAFAFLNP